MQLVMQVRSTRLVGILVALFIVVGLCFVNAGAQRRKRRPVRRHIAAATPSPIPDSESSSGDPQIISTADQSSQPPSQKGPAGPRRTPTPAPESEQEMLRRTITD